MEKNTKKHIIYTYNWITLLYTQNIVNQLYFNKKIKIKKKEITPLSAEAPGPHLACPALLHQAVSRQEESLNVSDSISWQVKYLALS